MPFSACSLFDEHPSQGLCLLRLGFRPQKHRSSEQGGPRQAELLGAFDFLWTQVLTNILFVDCAEHFLTHPKSHTLCREPLKVRNHQIDKCLEELCYLQGSPISSQYCPAFTQLHILVLHEPGKHWGWTQHTCPGGKLSYRRQSEIGILKNKTCEWGLGKGVGLELEAWINEKAKC